MIPRPSIVVFVSLLAVAASAGPGRGSPPGGSGGGAMPSGAHEMGSDLGHGSLSADRRMDGSHRQDATARETAAAKRGEGLATADESRREPPEQAVGFWTRAKRFFGFEKSQEQQSATAAEHEQATAKRPLGP